MQKISLAALALAAAAASAPAFAQSSVTIFGVVDVAARSVKNNDTQYQLATSGLQSSRLGFRGVEDLGGGLKAGFHLEGALNLDDGNASGFNFQRRATVSLMGGFGELRLGRDKTPNGTMYDDFDPFSNTGMGDSGIMARSAAAGQAYTTFTRVNNSIGYFMPNLGGLTAHAMVAAGEGTAGAKYTGIRVNYRLGGLLAGGAYGKTEVSAARDAELYDFGLSYDMKSFKLFSKYSRLNVGGPSQHDYLVGVLVPIGAFDLRASYEMMEGRGGSVSNQEGKKFAIGGAYNLSKRTAIYGTFANISNTNTAFRVAGNNPLSTGNDSTGYELGVRHSF
jgi:predicted porin